jgi:hypothetical protein
MALDVSLIKPGARVRLIRGSVIRSTNPSRPESTVTRPYWVVVDHIDPDGCAVWVGASAYYARTPLTSFDMIEAY